MNRARASALCLLGLAFASGCGKPKCPDPGDDSAGLDLPTVVRMKKEVSKNPSFCAELGAPRVALTSGELLVTGPAGARKVAARSDLPAAETKRVDALSNRLKTYREIWKEIHPNDTFPGKVELSFDGALETPRALSVLQTSVFVGYPFVHLTTGTITLDFAAFLPRPPRRGGTGLEPDPRTLFIETADATSSIVRLQDDDNCRDLGEKLTAPNDALGPAVSRVCAGKTPCAQLITVRVRATTRFEDTAKIARDVLAAYPSEPKRPELALTTGPAPACTKAKTVDDEWRKFASPL
jgi:hypothetical protein